MLQRDTSKKAFAQERFSTTTLKTCKSGNKKQSQQHLQQYFSGGKGGRPTSSVAAESQTQLHQQIDPNILNIPTSGSAVKSGAHILNSNRKGSQMTA